MVKFEGYYSVIGILNNSVIIIEDDECEYIINMMLKNGNLVFNWGTYKEIIDGRPLPILINRTGNLLTYKWPDNDEIFTFLADESVHRLIRYKLAVIWSADLPASKQINKLKELWPRLSNMKISEFLVKMKESSEWIFTEKCTLEVA